MEYRKDKRTKNLTLRDIHVGDWVQVWSEITERYSPPLKIIQICDDGTIYLVTSDEERPTPWEEDIKNVDALPITSELLKGFELEVKHLDGLGRMLWHKNNPTGFTESVVLSFRYIHELIDYLEIYMPSVKLEWKGIENDRAGI